MARRGTLRRWQDEALRAFAASGAVDFQVTATPGSGKTKFAAIAALEALAARRITQVIVVAPTDHLRTQWSEAAFALGLRLDPTLTNADGAIRKGFQGYSTTYAQVAANPRLHRRRCEAGRTLVVLDEIHHAGDGLSWGEAILEAFGGATRRLGLSGTPFRTRPGETIPFVQYETTGALMRSVADYSYGYAQGLDDGVVRPVVFAAYTGQTRWINSAGAVITTTLSGQHGGKDNTKADEALAWRTALDPGGQWVPHVIAAMDDRISHQRVHGIPDAGGLILASDQDSARAYAQIVHRVTGHTPTLVLSDDPTASKKINEFRDSDTRYAVCVRMISEGCDIPRATTIAYMTSYRTSLFFAQAVGRVVRSRRPGETATVFLPAVRPLLALAADIEAERDHVIALKPDADESDLDALVDTRAETATVEQWRPLGADAQFAHVLHGGRAHTGLAPAAAQADGLGRSLTDDDEDFLGFPGLLTPEQTASLLAKRDHANRRKAAKAGVSHPSRSADTGPGAPEPPWEELARLRRELNTAVSAVASNTGEPHAKIHMWVRHAVAGPPSRTADADTLRRRLTATRQRLTNRTVPSN
ncbi:MAG: DEAD/DEAH box helicase family protein [Actinomycetes bacterium]